MEEKIIAYFGYEEAGASVAADLAARYRACGYEVTLAKDSHARCLELATQAGAGHLLYFEDDTHLLFSLLTGQMQGFTTRMRTQDLVLPPTEKK